MRYAGKLADGVPVGPGFVQEGLNSFTSGIGTSFVAVAIGLFAFTTVLAYYYMAETNLAYFNRWIHSRRLRLAFVWGLRVLVVVSVVVGAMTTPGQCVGPGRHRGGRHGLAEYHCDRGAADPGSQGPVGLPPAEEGRARPSV